MRHGWFGTTILLCSSCLALCHLTKAQGPSQDPAQFTAVFEEMPNGRQRAIPASGFAEVDDQSSIAVRFDGGKMMPPKMMPSNEPVVMVEILITGFVRRGATSSPITAIPHYIDPPLSAGANADHKEVGKVQTHSKAYDPPASSVPGTIVDLPGIGVTGADEVVLHIINLSNQQTFEVHLYPRSFGFRTKTSDSFFLLRRLGVHSAETALGFDPSNFSPAPGVSYGGVYFARDNRTARFLQPGIGANVSFMSWKDPAKSNTTGQPATGTSTSSVQVGTGVVISFFSNVLQFTYGANLNVDKHRAYWGLGFSFVNLAQRIKGSQ